MHTLAVNDTANWADFFEVTQDGVLDYDEEIWNQIRRNATKSTVDSFENSRSKEFMQDHGIFVLLEVLQFVLYIANYFYRKRLRGIFQQISECKTKQNQSSVKETIWAEKLRLMQKGTDDASCQATFEAVQKVAADDIVHEVNEVDHQIEDALNNLVSIEIQVDMPPAEELDGLEQEDLEAIERQKRKEEEDRLREQELARIEAELQAQLERQKNLDQDTAEAKALKAKLGDFLEAVSGQKKGLSAIREKDISQLRELVAGIDEKQLVTILRIRYPGHMSAVMLADDLEVLRNRAIQMIRKFEEIIKMRLEIEKLKQSTIAEIRSMGAPPSQVKDVMMATFLLLGESQKTVSKWDNIRSLLGKTGKMGARRRILELDLSSLDGKYQTLKLAKQLCKEQTLADVQEVSVGAAVFFAWCLVTIDTLETTW